MPKSAIVDLLKKVCGDRDHAKDCYINLHNAVLATIMENLHLADGDVCTLKILKDAIDFELPPENAEPIRSGGGVTPSADRTPESP